MPGTLELTRRIKSVKSTRKITRAMQLVSAAKMRKAQLATLASRSYSELAWELIGSLGGSSTIKSPLIEVFPDAKKIGVIVVSSNRGLVGSFNNNLFNKVKELEGENAELLSEFVVLGKKAREMTKRLRKEMVAEFEKVDTTIPIEKVYPLVKLITQYYETGKYKKIYIVYNHFASTLVQQATIKQVLPLKAQEIESESVKDLLLEPSPEEVAKALLPRVLESQVYQAILESDASEHSARMVMMKNATESAGDLIDDLTLTYNQLRQNKITTELSEITAGKIALEKQ